jgi:phage shock protein A
MSIFKRIFKITQSETHAALEKFEDPIKMTEQGIRDLKADLQTAMTSLAEVKSMAIRTGRDADGKKKLAADYERKAMTLLQQMQAGKLDQAKAERLATEALNLKEQTAAEAVRIGTEAERHSELSSQLQANVNKIKSTITTYENDLTTLKARAKTAAATKKINQQIARIDSSGTISMLEKMKAKVEEDESLAAAYADLATPEESVEDEINAVLAGGQAVPANQSLEELKRKMGING